MTQSDIVIVAGGLFQRAAYGGHAWAFAQYVRGFRRLGWRSIFVDQVPTGTEVAWRSPAVAETIELLGGVQNVAVLDGTGDTIIGMGRPELLAMAKDAVLLVNVMGYLRDDALFWGPRLRLFLDIDPGFPQMWYELGLADVLKDHDAFVSVAGRVGESTSLVPTCGRIWIPSRPPVVLNDWPQMPPRPAGTVSSIASWRGPFGPVDFRETTYGLRVHEFRKFVNVATGSRRPFDLVLDIDPSDSPDIARLRDCGWHLLPPTVVDRPGAYRSFIGRSKAEFMVAKHMYVATAAGWFSDRTACYLATGRPAVVQDTGFTGTLPTGKGLLAFRTAGEAIDALAEIDASYEDHCDAARALAETHFDSDRVLTRLLDIVGTR
jgi:hypothetical protein